ncbi:MAG TPA: MotA/TolQ/ExbB proton channel family protein [Rubricoccaceae bacterium]|nr:MotA/TolQ/ExbB proton channel family protein [Rubricoccaceae bacterium]
MPRLLLALQVSDSLLADSLAPAVNLPSAPAQEPLSVLDLLVKGGWVMIPILLLSLLAVYVLAERLLALRRAHSDPDRLMRTVRDYVQSGDLSGAVGYCRAEDTPASRIIQSGLERVGRPIAEIREAVQAAGRQEAFRLEKHMDLLASAAALAPMLGFLGTVTGLIQAFQAIQYVQGSVSPALLANGMWEAMITTAAGLTVGIPAMFAYNFLFNRIRRTINDLERTATDFVDLLQTPARASEPVRPYA